MTVPPDPDPDPEAPALDEGLFGHWSSAPFDYGAMEGSDLGFLPDGRGWSVWASFGGSTHVTRFGWHCPRPGLLELREQWSAQGEWAAGTGARFASVLSSGPAERLIRTRYAFGEEPTLGGTGPPAACVRFAEQIEFTGLYARGERDIDPTQDPSYGH